MVNRIRHLPVGACLLGAALVVWLAGCATPPATPAASTPSPTGDGRPAAPAPAPVAPAAPAVPEITPAQAKAQSQRLSIEAVDQLQNGDEANAKITLERALALDSTNELAKKLLDEIRADAQKELGPVFFRYTVQRDDSLSKLAQQFMGDRFRFWILAKYNDIPNPSKLATGQVIKIPGRAPPPGQRPPVAADTAPKAAAPAAADAAPSAATPPPPRDDLAALLQKGTQQQAGGDVEGAYATFGEALARSPGNAEAMRKRDLAKVALIRVYDREASAAFQRQNLDLAISKWDKILELDPANQKAKLERDRALDLKKRLDEKFGAPK